MTPSATEPLLRNRSRSLAAILPRSQRWYRTIALCLGWVGSTAVSHALSFNLLPSVGTSQAAIDGFAAAGTRWSSQFTDNVNVNLNIAFASLGSGILGSAGSTQAFYTYSGVKTALLADATSAADLTAVANLQAGSAFSMLLNRTSNNPNGVGSATTYVDNDGDANNSIIRMTNANAKALGLLAGNNSASDASISFSTAFNWDFDPTDGITAGAFDFVGIATHEIGHALGFISGVDILDGNSPNGTTFFPDNAFTYVSTLDLFRYSTASRNAIGGPVIDWTADNRAKYFSIDGGATQGAAFSTGFTYGDGRQASHWKDNLGLGIMDPTSAPGELLAISANDLRAFDVIGWNKATAPVPDAASSLSLMSMGLAVVAILRRRRKTRTLAASGC